MLNYSRLRPDLWYWIEEDNERSLIIIEISIPFGRSNNEIDEDTLKTSDRKKRSKYAKMIRHIQGWLTGIRHRKIKYRLHFQTIIVSSIGAIPNFTLRNLSNIIGIKRIKEVSLWGKRLVVSALRGSFELWMKASPAVYMMMQEEVKMNEIPRKKERLIEVDEENPDIELLKEVVNAETESKEIENLRTKYEKETEEIKEFYDPELTGKEEIGNEQEEGTIMSAQMSEAEDNEFKRMLFNLNEVEVEKMDNEEVNVENPSIYEGKKESI
jgi:hypothetical protein